jgi:hypothetical protein
MLTFFFLSFLFSNVNIFSSPCVAGTVVVSDTVLLADTVVVSDTVLLADTVVVSNTVLLADTVVSETVLLADIVVVSETVVSGIVYRSTAVVSGNLPRPVHVIAALPVKCNPLKHLLFFYLLPFLSCHSMASIYVPPISRIDADIVRAQPLPVV